MQLDEFVQSTLEQIMRGVSAAQEQAKTLGAAVNPHVRNSGSTGLLVHHTGAVVQDVDFDVALTVAKSSESGAGLRVGVAGLGASVRGGSDTQNSQMSRIKFSVQLVLPVQPTS